MSMSLTSVIKTACLGLPSRQNDSDDDSYFSLSSDRKEDLGLFSEIEHVCMKLPPPKQQIIQDDSFEYSSSDAEDDYEEGYFETWSYVENLCSSPNDVRSLSLNADELSIYIGQEPSPFKEIQNRSQEANYQSLNCGDSTIPDPPSIKKSTDSATILEVLEEFPDLSWHGIISDDFLKEYDLKDDDSLRNVDSMTSFHTAWPRDENDEETVMVSNKNEAEPMAMKDIKGSRHLFRKNMREDVFESLGIKLSASLKLPTEKSDSSSGLKRVLGLKSFQDETANATADESTDSLPSWIQGTSFKDAEENILLGIDLRTKQKMRSSARRVRNVFKKIRHAREKAMSPEKKIYNVLKKRNYSPTSCSSRKGKPTLGNENIDWAVRSRLDGFDIINCGKARQISYIGQKQRHLVGQRYTLRSMILDTLWSGSGRHHSSEIVFEGFSPLGEGNDRWAARVADSGRKSIEVESTIWGNGNKAPPTCETKLNGQSLESNRSMNPNDASENIFKFQSLEQLRIAHDYAISPLKNGCIDDAIKLFKKLLRGMEEHSANCDMDHTIGSTYHNLALLLMWDNRFEDALSCMKEAICIRVSSLGKHHLSVAVSLAKIALIYFALEDLDYSLKSLNQALIIMKKIHGYEHAECAKIIHNIGIVRFHQGEKKALNYLIEALKIQQMWIQGSLCRECTIFDTSITLSNMAKFYLKKREYEVAAYLYEEALQLQTSVFRKDHKAVLDNLSNIAFSKALADEKTNALEIYKSLYERQVDKFGYDSHEAVETQGFMSIIHIQQSNYSEAFRCLCDVLQWQYFRLDKNHPALLNTMDTIHELNVYIRGDCASLMDAFKAEI